MSPVATRALLQSIQRNLSALIGKRVGAAVSGGADSVALLRILLELREKTGFVLSVVHFNHKLRGKASDADENFVEALAEKYGLTIHLGRGNIAAKAKQEKANLEDAGRRARYQFFDRLAHGGAVDYVLTAHTADDQAETVLGHLLRGTGLAGLAGIHPQSGCVLRPLLCVRRIALRNYLKLKKQKWREDATNRDTSRMRARMRKELLPLLERKFNPRAVEHLAALAEMAREDEKFLAWLARDRCEALSRVSGEAVIVNATDLLAPISFTSKTDEKPDRPNQETSIVNKPLSTRMVRKLAQQVKHSSGELSLKHVEAILQLAKTGENGKNLELPGKVRVKRERNELRFESKETHRAEKQERASYLYAIDFLKGTATVCVAETGCAFRLRDIDWASAGRDTNRDTRSYLDRAKLAGDLVLRNWQPGDRMLPQGHRTSRKLTRFFNDEKLSHAERQSWPVLTCKSKVVWVRGLGAAAEFAAGERTLVAVEIAEERV